MKNAKDEVFSDVLVRYGNKYQQDKQAAVNSLFGGEHEVEIATPEIVPAPAWSDLERLNRERDLVGIYLSAHPLDEFAVILDNVCNVHMKDLSDLTPLANHDLLMGGIVTGVREGFTKKGNPYGIGKVEDYTGSYEFAFFGADWVGDNDRGKVGFKNFFVEGMFLFIRGKCQGRQWRPDELEVKVNSIELLPDVKDKLIERFTIITSLSAINKEMIVEMETLMKENSGNTELCFFVRDDDKQLHVNLVSRTRKISVTNGLLNYIKSQPSLDYKIN